MRKQNIRELIEKGFNEPLSEEEALTICENPDTFNNWTDSEIVSFQLYQNRLCMSWDKFTKAVEKVLGRGVYTHEFAYREKLKNEFEGKVPKPTIEEIIGKIPKSKQLIIVRY